MAKSRIQRRQEAERQRIEGFVETLRGAQRLQRQPPDFQQALVEAGRGFAAEAIRAPQDWRPQMKTRDAGRLRLAAARHLFQRYAVAAHLEAIWLDQTGLPDAEVALRKAWYVAAARGCSLYKAGASACLPQRGRRFDLPRSVLAGHCRRPCG